ncbi:hypothetical protein G6F56_008390 [Rhizopus delemar]|uniref:Phosphotransferase n=1 Tax=Rhizopus stolonifer TaxID=4846 RepID=A0A367J3J9_RHIST|nr:hypothetical protein G6F56_008390 [Rhizopus delemar]RCH84512.1 glucokinase [Rhizopus stolonifer]
MVVNIEWGAFDPERKVLPYTIYDHKLNRESVEPDQQPFEKMISNLYLGEIVRNVILSLVDLRLIFSGQSSQELNQAGALTNSLPSILADRSENLEETSRVLEELEISTVWVDRQMVKCISSWVVSRAARLTACGVAAILSDSLQKEPTRIAIGGSVYELFPDFEKQLLDNLDELLGGLAKDVQLDLVRENIGLGAAIIALMAHQASLLQGPLR